MSIELNHRIYIAAPARRIYQAITTDGGIRNWWTTDVIMDAQTGGRAVFGFAGHSITFEMEIQLLEPPAVVLWHCVGGNSSEWIGTTQEFRLEPQSDGEILLKFCHAGWRPDSEYCYLCNTTWGHLLVCLKDYAEHGVANPYFK